MKKVIIFAALFFFAFSGYAQESILGKWKDKSDPSSYQYEFKKNNDFIYTQSWTYEGKTHTRVRKGVWEIGLWSITGPGDAVKSCTLTIYADTKECCFDYKFIGKNLIMTNNYRTDAYGGMCENRVLIKAK